MKKNQIILSASVIGSIVIGYIIYQQMQKKNKPKSRKKSGIDAGEADISDTGTDTGSDDGTPITTGTQAQTTDAGANAKEILANALRFRGWGTGSATTPASDTGSATGFKTYIVTSSTPLNIRSTASAQGKIIGSLPKGTKISAKPSSSGWFQYSKGGFVSGKYLKADTVASKNDILGTASSTGVATGAAAATGFKTYIVTSSTPLNIRSTASAQGKILGNLPKGTKISAKPSSSGWFQYSKGGFVSGKYLKAV